MTFDVFGDFETRGYLRNFWGLKDPAELKELEHRPDAPAGRTALLLCARKRPNARPSAYTTTEVVSSEELPAGRAEFLILAAAPVPSSIPIAKPRRIARA